jgi:hypothetical protein
MLESFKLASRSSNAGWKVWIESLDGKFHDGKLGWKVSRWKVWMESFLGNVRNFKSGIKYRIIRLVRLWCNLQQTTSTGIQVVPSILPKVPR